LFDERRLGSTDRCGGGFELHAQQRADAIQRGNRIGIQREWWRDRIDCRRAACNGGQHSGHAACDNEQRCDGRRTDESRRDRPSRRR
jgi:hypothetical protein